MQTRTQLKIYILSVIIVAGLLPAQRSEAMIITRILGVNHYYMNDLVCLVLLPVCLMGNDEVAKANSELLNPENVDEAELYQNGYTTQEISSIKQNLTKLMKSMTQNQEGLYLGQETTARSVLELASKKLAISEALEKYLQDKWTNQ